LRKRRRREEKKREKRREREEEEEEEEEAIETSDRQWNDRNTFCETNSNSFQFPPQK